MNPEVRCVQGLPLWRNSSSDTNNELYKGYRKGNTEEQINEIVAGRFFLSMIVYHLIITAVKMCKTILPTYFYIILF